MQASARLSTGPAKSLVYATAPVACLLVCALGDAAAQSPFWQHWGDGKAELSGYRVTTERYGQSRQARVVLVYVTEPMDSRVWVKDDSGRVPKRFVVPVLKLNHMLTFRTGIYPYSVMTSTFAPVDPYQGRAALSPVKIALSAQEWCGHVYQRISPEPSAFSREIRSYFWQEGDRSGRVRVPKGTLYEDALLIQLRELKSAFHGGRTRWQGHVVPTIWQARKSHRALAPRAASIRRETVNSSVGAGAKSTRRITRFLLKYKDAATRTFLVERRPPRRILGWQDSRGEQATLLKTVRLPYWQLNRLGDERYLKRLGL